MNLAPKILDGVAWGIAAVALCAGLLCLAAVGLFSGAWLLAGRSYRSLVWALSDRTWVLGLAGAWATTLALDVVAVALARRGRGRPPRVSMAGFAMRLAVGCLAATGLSAALTGLILASRAAASLGLW